VYTSPATSDADVSDGVLAWLSQPRPDRGIHFAAPGDGWDFWSYSRLAARSRAVAAALRRSGVGPGDTVVILSRGGPGFVAALFGVLRAGAAASPLPPPQLFGDRAAYEQHIRAALDATRPAAVAVDGELAERTVALAGAAVLSLDAIPGDAADDPQRPVPAEAASLVQFTSGSSGRSRPIRVSHRALAANVAAIRRWLGMNGADATASWLPVHHDMGLTGCLIAPVTDGSNLWLLPPDEFVRRPLRYLRCFGEGDARLTAMPAFGLAHLLRRVRPADLVGLDLSRWRAVIVGAERIDPDTAHRFLGLLAPHGLRPEALLPAYGLAEATLAVTGRVAGAPLTTVRCDPTSLTLGRPVRRSDDPAHPAVLGCGRPLDGVEVDIAAADGEPVPDGTVGEIVVRGRSLGDGYAAAPGSEISAGSSNGSLTAFTGGGLRTGDAGFRLDGELFVLGRLGDSLKVRGRTVFAEDLEAAVAGGGVPARRFIAVLGVDAGRATAVGILERPEDGWAEAAERVLRRLAEGARIVVVAVGPGEVARTSSGKPKRRLLWQRFVAGALPPARTAAQDTTTTGSTTGGWHD